MAQENLADAHGDELADEALDERRGAKGCYSGQCIG